MAFLKAYKYADGRLTFSRHQRRAVDSGLHSSLFASQSSEEEYVWYLDANHEDISRRIDRMSRDFAVQLAMQTHFQQALSKFKNGDAKYQAPEPNFCQRSGLDNWLKPSFRSNIESLTDNNPNITDLSDRNRPTRLAEKYAELYDNQWTDAFDVLEKSYQREEYVIGTLLHILQDVFTFCLKKAKAEMKNLGQELKFADRKDNGDVAVDARNNLKECSKAMGLTGNLPKMYQSHLEQSTNDRTKAALKVREFTAECLEMCWFMVIQDPPVAFAPLLSKGSSFDTEFYKPYTISGAKVDFVVWPPLLLHEGGPILAKGVAQGCDKQTTS